MKDESDQQADLIKVSGCPEFRNGPKDADMILDKSRSVLNR